MSWLYQGAHAGLDDDAVRPVESVDGESTFTLQWRRGSSVKSQPTPKSCLQRQKMGEIDGRFDRDFSGHRFLKVSMTK